MLAALATPVQDTPRAMNAAAMTAALQPCFAFDGLSPAKVGAKAGAKRSNAPAVIEVALCRDRAMLKSAQRLRYEVYCAEFGRRSPYADHARKLISDPLDRFGHTFIATEDGETIGTLRTNFSSEGPLGVLEKYYGMRASKHHPARTAICTKFIVKKSKRGSLAFLKLLTAWLEHVAENGISECYIDCTPNLLRFYERCEFVVCGAPFLHPENGLSFPMMVDLTRHGKALRERFCARVLA
jgi:predicted GNAT family N-acyltransferase